MGELFNFFFTFMDEQCYGLAEDMVSDPPQKVRNGSQEGRIFNLMLEGQMEGYFPVGGRQLALIRCSRCLLQAAVVGSVDGKFQMARGPNSWQGVGKSSRRNQKL